MVRTSSLFVLCLSLLGLAPACSSSSRGGDDDDLVVDTDGDADSDADSDADADADGDAAGTCADACANVGDICPSGDAALCLESCNRFADFSEGACLDAFAAYNGCVADATECDDQNGIAGCDRQAQGADDACTNGCLDIVSCFNACAEGDDACQQACVDNADAAGLRALQTLLGCWTDACGDPPADPNDQAANETWQACLDGACQDEYTQCR